MIVCERLTKYFGHITAIKELSIEIPDGEVFGLLGPNGAGKTTTMRMLACLIKPSFGSAKIDDLEIGPENNNLKIRSKIGLLTETPGLYDSLGAYKNLDYYAQFFDISKSKREENIESILKNLGLWNRRHTPVGEFSKGMKQKIAIARALIHEPKYIFLDEPTASLDPQAAKTVREYILELKSKGNTILINTHNLNEAEKVCDRVALLKNKMIKVGKPKEMAHGLFGRNIKVTLDRFPKSITDKMLKFDYITEAKIQNNQLVLNVKNPEEDNNRIITWLLERGLKVQFISEEEYSLEDVYLKLIDEEADEQ